MRTPIATLALCLLPSAALALDVTGGLNGTPVNYAQRGLTLPAGGIRVDVGPADWSLRNGFYGGALGFNVSKGFRYAGIGLGGGSTSVGLGIGGAYGVMEDLEAGIQLLPFVFSPGFDFGDLQLYGRYAFLKGDGMALGAQLAIQIPTQTQFGFSLAVPAIFRVGEMAKIETGVDFNLVFDPTIATLSIPVAFTVGIMEPLYIGARSGIALPDMNFDLFTIPLGILAGYTLAGGSGPWLDLTVQWYWNNLFTFFSPGDKVNIDQFTLTFGANLHFGL